MRAGESGPSGNHSGRYGGNPEKGDGLEFQGKGLAFLHNNIDPTKTELSISGNFTSQAGAFMFTPNHSGTIDREPAEVTADGQIYCYNADSWNCAWQDSRAASR